MNSDAGRELRGVWSLAPERFHLLSSYILYSALDNSGYVYGPLLELKSPFSDPEGRKVVLKRRSGRSNRDQWLSYVETTVMTRVFVHVVHISEVVQSSGEAEFVMYAESAYVNALETHPEASWQELARLSHAARDIVL